MDDCESADSSAFEGPAMAAGVPEVGDLGYSMVETFHDEPSGPMASPSPPYPTAHGSTPK